MKRNKGCYPPSFSEDVRIIGTALYESFILDNHYVTARNTNTNELEHFYGETAIRVKLNNSSRHPIIINRAAKRVHRLIRKHSK